MADCEIVELSPSPTAVVRASVVASDLSAFFGRAFSQVAAAVADQGRELVGEPFSFYPGAPTDVVEVAAGFRVTAEVERSGDVVPMELPGGRAVTTVHVGPYDAMDKTYHRMHVWMSTQGLTPAGHMWEVYLSGPDTRPDPSTWRTQVIWPVDD